MTNQAKEIRKTILKMANRAGSPHIGSALSCVDIFSALYFDILDISKESFENRDIFLLSKAHSAMALYATLFHRGLLSEEQILGYYKSTLPAHTDRDTSPFVEISAGSLGHGLPIGVGMALALKGQKNSKRKQRKVCVLMGDGEAQEGSVWEAAMFAPKYDLGHLIVLIDRNNLQGYGRASELVSYEVIDEKWRSFGWGCQRVDGHDERAIIEAIREHNGSKIPLCLVCDTIKGKGVSFMEDELKWHYFLVTDEILVDSLEELQ